MTVGQLLTKFYFERVVPGYSATVRSLWDQLIRLVWESGLEFAPHDQVTAIEVGDALLLWRLRHGASDNLLYDMLRRFRTAWRWAQRTGITAAGFPAERLYRHFYIREHKRKEGRGFPKVELPPEDLEWMARPPSGSYYAPVSFSRLLKWNPHEAAVLRSVRAAHARNEKYGWPKRRTKRRAKKHTTIPTAQESFLPQVEQAPQAHAGVAPQPAQSS